MGMHFLTNLLRYMIPIQAMVMGQTDEFPSGDDRVITKRGNYVVTARSNFVIAKKYV
jgi:hypothetical protein